MVTQIAKLTYEEKLYMILNKHSFNIPSISIISSESEKWIDEIKTHVSPDVIEEYKKTSTSIYLRKRYSTINKEQANEEIINIIDSNLYNISIMPSETKENITDIFFIISSLLMKLSERERALSIDLSLDKRLICEYLFTTLLPWKVRAHEITVKSNSSISDKDNQLNDYYTKTLRCLFKELVLHGSNINYCTVIIYQIINYLNPEDKDRFRDRLTFIVSVFLSINKEQIDESIAKINNNDENTLQFINQCEIQDKENNSCLTDIISNVRKSIEENYSKDRISDRVSGRGLAIGDDVFDNGSITLSSLIRELDELNEDRLKDYIGENKSISYSIPENDIGYLKTREKVPVCKVITKDDTIYSITRYNDSSYLLFKIVGDDNKCYGISFPSGYGGERHIAIFELPNNYQYIMSM